MILQNLVDMPDKHLDQYFFIIFEITSLIIMFKIDMLLLKKIRNFNKVPIF